MLLQSSNGWQWVSGYIWGRKLTCNLIFLDYSNSGFFNVIGNVLITQKQIDGWQWVLIEEALTIPPPEQPGMTIDYKCNR
ncbi:hypothetical protein BGI35_00490 [Snodgrassella communis]|jgi:hypothetical protein|nr:hypothetical protein BGI31_09090 [Snodgrassella communis]PIT24830.1 hypothetical protein BGI35_00490 [Snodgrassella communis]